MTHPALPTAASFLKALQALPYTKPEEARPQMLALAREFRDTHLRAAQAAFEIDGNADTLTHALSQAMDALISGVCSLLMPGTLGISVIATGGYGRAELFPYSDVDLLFLYRPATRGPAERISRDLLYILWDMGLKVGHALRTEDDAIALALEDLTVRTNLLDMRQVVGDREMFASIHARYCSEIIADTPEAFVEAKLSERDARHKRFGDSRYLLEPNIKEGKGGLRDLQTLYWVARYVFDCDVHGLVERGYITQEEFARFERARIFLSTLRVHLHLLAGKAEERLTFDRQQLLAPLMGYRANGDTRAVERMMKRYFMVVAGVGNLTRIVCALLEEQHKRTPRKSLLFRLSGGWRLDGFVLQGDRLTIREDEDFMAHPVRMLKLFYIAQKQGCDIHPHALQAVTRSIKAVTRAFTRDAEAGGVFMDILLGPRRAEQTLRRMNEVGLLPRFIPEFAHIFGQMQFNMYHIYTVDEHTLVALGVLHGLERGEFAKDMPVASRIARNVEWRRSLYLALFCHDIAKGSGSDHSEGGADIARTLATRFGLSASEIDMTAWLVRNHLLFTHTAFKRDPNDPQALSDFVTNVQSLARLKLLFLLTVSDMRAVGPGVWNAWKANLLRSLFSRAERYMQTGRFETGEQQTADLMRELHARLPGWSEQQLEKYLALCTPEYLAGMDIDSLARAALLLSGLGAVGEPLSLDATHASGRGITDLTVLAPDSHALFSRLAGAISLSGANIVGAKIFTLRNGVAVDIFQVQDENGRLFDKPDRLSRLTVRMRQSIAGELDVEKELAKQKPLYPLRRDAFQVEGQVFIENDASATHTVIEVVGRDRVGFLYSVTRVLSEQGLTISSAHISTYGVQAVDVFYVKDAFGFKVTHTDKLRELRAALMAAVAPEVEAGPENQVIG